MSETMEATAATTNEGEATSTPAEQTASTEQPIEAAETQAAETQEVKEDGAPEQYEFKAPEGKELDGKFVEVYSEVAKELNLSQDKAQALIDKLSPVIEARQMDAIESVRTNWAEASKADKEFGGDKLEQNLGVAKQALDKFGTPELKEFINMTGIGNNPELIRFFYRAGKSLSEDTFVGGHKEDNGGDRPKSFNDFAAKLYT